MTEQTVNLGQAYANPEQAPEPHTETVAAGAGTRLEQLHAAYADAKAKADQATAELKVITDGIKAELTAAAPEGSTKIELVSGTVPRPALRLNWVESWRFDSVGLKKADRATYVRFAKKSGSWVLKAAPVGGGQ